MTAARHSASESTCGSGYSAGALHVLDLAGASVAVMTAIDERTAERVVFDALNYLGNR
jgi:hypothetical protein